MIHQKKSILQGLYAITDGNTGQLLLNKVEAALQGGVSVLQYRDKTIDQQRRLKEAIALKQLCQKYQVTFIINDDVELAHKINADGVHLGQDDTHINTARKCLGATSIIGVSCYNQLSLAKKAYQKGVNYVAFGSMFASPTKPNAPKASISLLNQAKDTISLPICTIGGITLDNASKLVENGADMIAVISHLFAQKDIKTTAQTFSALFD